MLGFPVLTLHTPIAFLALILTTPLCWRLQQHNAIQPFAQSSNKYPRQERHRDPASSPANTSHGTPKMLLDLLVLLLATH